MKKIRILIAEDEPVIAMDLEQIFKSIGYNIAAVVSSGEEAIKKAEELKPDLVIMDIVLSGEIDGIYATKDIQEKHNIPVVYLTAHTEGNTFKRAKETEPFGYLVKPIGKNDLYTAIETALSRHQLEARLIKSEKHYRSIIEDQADMICRFLPDFTITFANKAYCSYFNKQTEKLIGGKNIPHVSEKMKKNFKTEILSLNRKKSVIIDEYMLKDPNGKNHWFQWNNRAIFNEKGELIELQAVGRDINERKKMEDALMLSEQKLNFIVNSVPDIVYLLDRDGKIFYINDAITKYGYSTEKMTGTNIFDLIHPEDREKAVYKINERRTGTRRAKRCEIRLLTKNQNFVTFEINSNKVESEPHVIVQAEGLYSSNVPKSESFIGTVGAARDITYQKEAERRLKNSLREKESLLKEVHHRVKNNLQIINSLLDMQELRIQDEEFIQIFQDSQNRIRAMAIIHERLYQSKDLSRIDFAEYINIVTRELCQTYLCDPDRITLQINTEEVYLGIYQAIPFGLVVNELVSNSIKHAFPPQLKRKGIIKITLKRQKNDIIELIISDNGTGIPGDVDIHKLKSLGLKLVNNLIKEQLKGELEFIPQKGSKFIVKFKIEEFDFKNYSNRT